MEMTHCHIKTSLMSENEEMVCASQERCMVKELPRSSAHNCPGCGYNIHALCGHLHEEADIQFKTTYIHCYEKFGCALMNPDDATALQQRQQDEERRHDSNQGQEEGMVVLSHVNIMDSILPPEIDKQSSTIRECDIRKAKKEANKMKSLQLMNLANIRGNTRAKSTMSRHQSEHEVFLLYLYKHEDQLKGLEMLAQINISLMILTTFPFI